MMKKLFIVALVTLAALVVAGPAMAQGYGMGNIGGAYGGSGASVGAPQDCMATVSCNIPVTQMVPYQTSTTAMQTVNYPVTVPQQSAVTVPREVCVPEQVSVTVPRTVVVPEQVSVTVPKTSVVAEQVPVTTYSTACAQAQVPVQVPAVAYQPVTSMVPKTQTFCLGDMAAGAGMGATAAQGGVAPGAAVAAPGSVGLGAAAQQGAVAPGAAVAGVR